METLETVSQGGYVLAVEGGVPTAFSGHACTVWTETDTAGQPPDVTLMERYLRHPPREPDYRRRRSHTAFVEALSPGINPQEMDVLLQRLVRICR